MKHWSGMMKSNNFTAEVEIDIIPAAWHKLGEWYGSGIVRNGSVIPGNHDTDLGKVYIRHIHSDDSDLQKFSFIGKDDFLGV